MGTRGCVAHAAEAGKSLSEPGLPEILDRLANVHPRAAFDGAATRRDSRAGGAPLPDGGPWRRECRIGTGVRTHRRAVGRPYETPYGVGVTDPGRAGSIASIPLSYFAFELRIEHLCVVAFINGSLGIFNEVASRTYLPSLVARDRLLEANSRMAASDAVVEQIGFSVGGFIAQLASTISASVVQAVIFAVPGLLILTIRRPEPKPVSDKREGNIRRELIEGYRFIISHRLLRLVAISGAISAGVGGIIGGMITLFAITE